MQQHSPQSPQQPAQQEWWEQPAEPLGFPCLRPAAWPQPPVSSPLVPSATQQEGSSGARLPTPSQQALPLAPLGEDPSRTQSLERTASLASLPSLNSLPPLGSLPSLGNPLIPAAVPAAAVPVHQAHFAFLGKQPQPQPQLQGQAQSQWSCAGGCSPSQPAQLPPVDAACNQPPTCQMVRSRTEACVCMNRVWGCMHICSAPNLSKRCTDICRSAHACRPMLAA